jgi:hypothetical protein
MSIKHGIIFIFFIANALTLYGQEDMIPGVEWAVNTNTADSLIKLNEYCWLIRSTCDFRYRVCWDSIASKYHMKVFSLNFHIILDGSIFKRMEEFNSRMNEALVKVNGENWKMRFEEDVSACVNNICTSDSIRKYFEFGDQLCQIDIVYHKGQKELNLVQKCVIDNVLVKHLLTIQNFNIELIGPSKSRVKYLKNYLVTKGTRADRIIMVNRDWPSENKVAVRFIPR